MISPLAQIDFAPLRRDLLETAFSRVLGQFRASSTYLQFLAALIDEAQILFDALIDLQEGRTLFAAEGAALDGLGRIVGKPRLGYRYSEEDWMFADRGGQGADQSAVWCLNARMASFEPANDAEYRMQIYAKAVCNHAKFGSYPELSDMILMVTGENVSFERIGPMCVRMLASSGMSRTNLTFLLNFVTSMQTDDAPPLPFPATLSIDEVMIFLPVSYFCADRPAQGTDAAPVAVGAVRGL